VMQSIAVCWSVCCSRFADRCQLGNDTVAEETIWKICYLRLWMSKIHSRMWMPKIHSRISQITNQKTISTPTMVTKNQHRGMLPRSEAIKGSDEGTCKK
jgi:hypothetical protein